MTEPVLTDEEKGALLEGMSSGEVEVHSNRGPTYATVKPFEIGSRARISTNSYPRLQTLNRQFASRMGKQTETLLNAEATINPVGVRTISYSDSCDACDASRPRRLRGSTSTPATCDDSKMRCLCVSLCVSVPLWFKRDAATEP